MQSSQSYLRMLGFLSVLLFAFASSARAWDLPPDKGVLPGAQVQEILKGSDYSETGKYTQKLEYVDFVANGQTFTQVVMRLDPEKPRLHRGKKIVLVATEEGSSSANGFIETDEGKEGIGVWLAKRGVTFIALNRLGRWNFFAPNRRGTWESIPLDERMPIFSQHQKQYWSKDDWISQAAGTTSSSTGSEFVRYPKPGTELYRYMLAATPVVMVDGFEKGLRHVLSPEERRNSLLLYWGFSTGGAIIYPLAERIRPDGYLNWGTTPPGVVYYYAIASGGRFDWPYEKSALRVRGRGLADFDFYNRAASAEAKKERWQRALYEPRFKAVEDSVMFFNSAALTETAMRLYLSDFLPREKREGGYVKLLDDILAVSKPGPALKQVPVWEMNGTLDEVYPPKVVDAFHDFLTPYVAKHRIARIEGFHHSIEYGQSKVIGTMWLRAIDSGFFDR